jgi:hypothetical protein
MPLVILLNSRGFVKFVSNHGLQGLHGSGHLTAKNAEDTEGDTESEG